MHREVIARAPTRIDLGGGWTDVPPYCDREGGFVCNIAITLYSVASLAAAYMSTISTHLNWGASYMVDDVYRRFYRPEADERQSPGGLSHGRLPRRAPTRRAPGRSVGSP